MAKRLTQLEKAIQNLDAQIEALQLARHHLIEQESKIKPKATRKPRLMPGASASA